MFRKRHIPQQPVVFHDDAPKRLIGKRPDPFGPLRKFAQEVIGRRVDLEGAGFCQDGSGDH